jgi:hypothetical protein
MRTYAGIGSRRTPTSTLELMAALAAKLAQQNYTLRSGHASGADQAFECGAFAHAEVYLPWPGFEQSTRCDAIYLQGRPTDAAIHMASEHHPSWDRLSDGARLLHARNCHQILGRDLNDPVSFVVCWTPDGATTNPGPETGGTGQALRLALAQSIPIFNLARSEDLARIQRFIS